MRSISRLPHTGFEMTEVQPDAATEIPDEIVEIATFDAALPIPAQHGMKLVGKKAGKIVNSNFAMAVSESPAAYNHKIMNDFKKNL